MAKMRFDRPVKYQGTRYPSNTAITVFEEDVEELKKAGGWVLESSNRFKDFEEDPVDEDDEKEPEDPVDELELLRNEAAELGIEFKKNWGVKKLREAIDTFEG